ncbi:MAG TPA: hypothetical protein PLY93_12265, partial [Turneriella sp.]|nr:hypothetical protein [Turneriella sp.]
TCHPYCRHRLSPVPEETLVDVVSASPETHSEIEKRIQKQTSGNIDISRLDTVGQRSLSNVLEDIYERYPNLPKLESVVATNRHLSDENGAPIFASMDNKELKIYAGAQDNDNLRRILKRENRDLKAINGRTAHHYESIDDVIRHEFGHYIAESNNMIGGNYTIFTGMVENAGLMSHIMTNKNEFFPELFLLFEKGVLAEKLPIVDAHMRQLLTRIFG